ncbi:cyclin-D5-1-like isoform X2 [Mercurialis annua]|uniref:cyclin-D5-1-like isoform X2 n=1 Tax=Mercurialis annua TaxID=3986 RepID=UPI00215E3EFA|nr:cyclin-D5-1-like isoform X2 [Mercurialis annua]
MSDFDHASLLCQEDEVSCFNETFQDLNSSYSSFVLESEEIEYIEKMVELETRNYSIHSSEDDDGYNCTETADFSWVKCARLDAIEWIFNTRAILGFHFHTAYLSVTYFDRFLSKRSIDDGKLWAIRLLSVACLSLAAKMEECRVPSLSEFPIEDYCFENKVIQRMELLILNTLDWKMGSITPFSYLHYFINKLYGQSSPKETISRAVELVLAVIKEISLVDYRPSIIAVAAVLAASDHPLTRPELEIKMKVISSWGSLDNENIYSCYIIMQEISMGKIKTPKELISSSIQSNSVSLGGGGIKRRLTYNDNDQNCPLKKISHQP